MFYKSAAQNPPMELCVIKGQQKTSQKYLEFALLVQLYLNPMYSTWGENTQWGKSLWGPHALVMCCISLRISLIGAVTNVHPHAALCRPAQNGTFQQDDAPCNTSRAQERKNHKNVVFSFCLINSKQQNNKLPFVCGPLMQPDVLKLTEILVFRVSESFFSTAWVHSKGVESV